LRIPSRAIKNDYRGGSTVPSAFLPLVRSCAEGRAADPESAWPLCRETHLVGA
jgi:hypothetical protein